MASPITLLYMLLFLISLGFLVHLRIVQRDHQRIILALQERFNSDEKENDCNDNAMHSRILAELTSPSTRVKPFSRYRRWEKIRDSPMLTLVIVIFSRIIFGIGAAILIIIIMFFEVDLLSFLIFIGFFVYVVNQDYFELLQCWKATRSITLEEMTLKDLQLIKKTVIKLKDLQGDQVFLMPMFILLSFGYVPLRDALIDIISGIVFSMQTILLFSIFQKNLFLGTVLLMLILVISFSLIIMTFINLWKLSRHLRRKLIP